MQNTSTTLSFIPSLNVQIGYKALLSFQMNAGYEFNRTSYSLAGWRPIDYNVKRLQIVARINPFKRLLLISSVYHTFNSQLPPDFQRARSFVNTGASYNFLKNERLTAALYVNDLLNNNINTTRTVTATAIETTQSDQLRRYAVLSVSYRINDF